jgi:hypothetical protein
MNPGLLDKLVLCCSQPAEELPAPPAEGAEGAATEGADKDGADKDADADMADADKGEKEDKEGKGKDKVGGRDSSLAAKVAGIRDSHKRVYFEEQVRRGGGDLGQGGGV